jgi:uncharacterized protein (TIGR02466 family)
MSNIHLFFPSAFFYEENILENKELIKLKKHSLEILKKFPKGGKNWLANINNTCETYNIVKDIKFNSLINIINNKVNYFNFKFGSIYEYKNPIEGWINLYHKNDYQEYHSHPNFIYSAVYYVQSEKDVNKRSTITFENPYQSMLPPINIKEHTNLSFETCHFKPAENSLLIFRSHLRHHVSPNKNKNKRISLAFNY